MIFGNSLDSSCSINRSDRDTPSASRTKRTGSEQQRTQRSQPSSARKCWRPVHMHASGTLRIPWRHHDHCNSVIDFDRDSQCMRNMRNEGRELRANMIEHTAGRLQYRRVLLLRGRTTILALTDAHRAMPAHGASHPCKRWCGRGEQQKHRQCVAKRMEGTKSAHRVHQDPKVGRRTRETGRGIRNQESTSNEQ